MSDDSNIFNVCKALLENQDLIQWNKIVDDVNKVFVIVFLTLLFVFLLVSFARVVWILCQKVCKWQNYSLRNHIFLPLAFTCFFGGTIVYYFGYDYGGTSQNALTLLLRSGLSSLEMFLSKSNLIGIAGNCKNSPGYMFAFAAVHTLAVGLSASFAVACLWKRLKDGARFVLWKIRKSETTYVFWGLNERNFMLARDVYDKRQGNERIVMIDFPEEREENNKSQGFSGLIGLFSFRRRAVRELKGIKYVLYRSSCRPSEVLDGKGMDFFDELGLMSLKMILKKSKNRKHFVFTNNESSNLGDVISMLRVEEFNNQETSIYCAARQTRFTTQLVEQNKGKLIIVDDSRKAVQTLKKREVEQSSPIEYVTIDEEHAAVTSVFTAMVIGFGTTGQDALRFLYEFSALPDEQGNKQKVRIDVIDAKMDSLEGDFRQEVPTINSIKVSGNLKENYGKMDDGVMRQEIFLRKMDVGSDKFYELLSELTDSLNYVVVATGDDDLNLSIASYIIDFMVQNRNTDQDRFKVFVRLYMENNRIKFESAQKVFGKMCDDYKNHGRDKEKLHFFSAPFVFFGSPQSLYTKSNIVENNLEEDAKKFFEEYNRLIGDKTTWDERRETANDAYNYRALCRKESQDEANSMHRYTKELLLGIGGHYGEVAYYDKWSEVLAESTNDNAEQRQWKKRLIQASICEHLRWNAAHLMLGYIPMSSDKCNVWASSADEQCKEHVHLRHWNKLNVDTQGFDYGVVKTTISLKNKYNQK